MADFNYYKQKISLADFLISQFGFKPVAGSSRQSPKLLNNFNGHRIVIKKNSSGHFTYFDVDGQDRGMSILDITQQCLALQDPLGKTPSLIMVAKYLDAYIESGKFIPTDQSTWTIQNESVSWEQFNKVLYDLRPIDDFSFLNSRGIDTKIIKHPFFNSQLFNRDYLFNDKMITNTCFYMMGKGRVVALSQRNQNFKGALGSRSEGLCTSHLDGLIENNTSLDKVYFAESFIDCMSHFQLNFDEIKNKNVVYLSSEGYPTDSQLLLLQYVLDNYKPQNLSLLLDNDQTGHSFSARVLGFISLPNSLLTENSISHKLQFSDIIISTSFSKTNSNAQIIIPDSKVSLDAETFLLSKFSEVNNRLSSHFSYTPLTFSSQNLDNSKIFYLSFPTSNVTWLAVSQMVGEIKFSGFEKVTRETPFSKDFNDDLRILKNIHPTLSLSADLQLCQGDKKLYKIDSSIEYLKSFIQMPDRGL